MSAAACTVDGCEQPILNKTRQLCRKHYQRWWKHGDPLIDARAFNTGRPANAPAALWDRVQIGGPDECWPWLGAKRRRGYGTISVNGRNYITHRLAYQIATGEDPGDLLVCHRCDNPPCCNPAHLFLGTPLDNVRDMHSKGRWRSSRSRLNRDDVIAIRALLEDGLSQTAIAAQYGVTSPHISRIARGLSWRHAA